MTKNTTRQSQTMSEMLPGRIHSDSRRAELNPVQTLIVLLPVCLTALRGIEAVQVAANPQVIVQNTTELRTALAELLPGTTLKLAPGDYDGGNSVSSVPQLTIEALDTEDPPHFLGGDVAWHFSRCEELTLRHLKLSGQKQNGLNLDDGGQIESPVRGITIDHVEVSKVGPKGNCDGIKCSGLQNLTLRDCRISGWGGQAIDLVGCHDSLISNCRFIGMPGFTASAGVQIKGGSSKVTVEKCHLRPRSLGSGIQSTIGKHSQE